MIAKTFELRDRSTFIPVLAVKLSPGREEDRYLLARTGYGQTADMQARYVLMAHLQGDRFTVTPRDWGHDNSRRVCHQYIIDHFDELPSGSVIDAEFIRGESAHPKISERFLGQTPQGS